ncbi:CBS domain-containing protein [Nodularia spumigena CS-588/02]|uniref:CBS domain-containing protein n=1 Tax=Nodularia spumigena TaxID=70799 RepID=UPI002330D755|nr:CBS domain-containing protein [Nodularia spumigena]MDB9361171.1 CBS domain-containing protein [Nodularia spumigena CS-588/02]MDB9366793.1 CBS domain-containing protein [Nodularia spumigena CS-588/02A10]
MRFHNQLIDLPNLYHAIDQCPVTISPDSYVVDAIFLIHQERSMNSSPTESNSALVDSTRNPQHTTCILVVDQGKLLGILTHTDIKRITSEQKKLDQVKIAEVMVQPVITLKPSHSQDILTALSLLRQHQIRHLPILDQQGLGTD